MKKLLLLLLSITALLHADARPKYAIVIGASQGIGREIALQLSSKGYIVGAVARRFELLKTLQQEALTQMFIAQVDIANTDESAQKITQLIEQMGGHIDVAIMNAAVWPEIGSNNVLCWEEQKPSIDVNVSGCARLMTLFSHQFVKQNSGHLVTISSVSALRGDATAPVYSASKAFLSIYAESLRNYFDQNHIPVIVSDCLLGMIKTAESPETCSRYFCHPFWYVPYKKAVKQIIDEAVEQKKKCIYVSHRWKVLGLLMQCAPDWFNNAIGGF